MAETSIRRLTSGARRWAALGAGFLLAWLGFPERAAATVDGGISAALIGVAGGGRYAIVEEGSVQADCSYESCTVYTLDLQANGFVRKWIVELPGRYEELWDSCAPSPGSKSGKLPRGEGSDADGETPEEREARRRAQQQCSHDVSQQLADERVHAGGTWQLTLQRYTQQLASWQRGQLGQIEAPPQQLGGVTEDDLEGRGPRGKRPVKGVGELVLELEPRWQVPSFRGSTASAQYCSPSFIPACSKQMRWVDGLRGEYWVCPYAEVAQKPRHSAQAAVDLPPIDCGGHAVMVRVRAGWSDGPTHPGRTNLVEPGALMQAVMVDDASRTVDIASLELAPAQIAVHHIGDRFVVVGGFGHATLANGTWYPLVVVLPGRPGG